MEGADTCIEVGFTALVFLLLPLDIVGLCRIDVVQLSGMWYTTLSYGVLVVVVVLLFALVC
jgi:hypothetical protein